MTKSDTKPFESDRRVLLGVFANAHGIKGEVQVRTYTGEPEAIASYGTLTDKSGQKSFKLKIVRVTDKGVIARVDGVGSRNAAEALKGIELYVTRNELPETHEDEYYHADLIGLRAVSPDGETIGKIVAVENYGAGDLLVIEISSSKDTEFVPFSEACVPHIDFDSGTATVVMPVMAEGQLEPDS